MADLRKTIIVLGVVFIIVGSVISFFSKVPFLAKLPGDIFIQKDNCTVYFPVVTSLLISVILSIILNIFMRK